MAHVTQMRNQIDATAVAATLAAPNGSPLDAGFSPYRSTRLSR